MEKRNIKTTNKHPNPHNSNVLKIGYTDSNRLYKNEKFISLLIKYRNIIISYLYDTENLSITELYKHIPIRILRKELDILEYYGVIRKYKRYIQKGNRFGNIDITSLPLPCLISYIKPHEKVIYDIVKMKECFSIDDIIYTMRSYGLRYSYGVVQHGVRKFINTGVMGLEKIDFNVFMYRIFHEIFIRPVPFEEKIKEAIEWKRKWENKYRKRLEKTNYFDKEGDEFYEF